MKINIKNIICIFTLGVLVIIFFSIIKKDNLDVFCKDISNESEQYITKKIIQQLISERMAIKVYGETPVLFSSKVFTISEIKEVLLSSDQITPNELLDKLKISPYKRNNLNDNEFSVFIRENDGGGFYVLTSNCCRKYKGGVNDSKIMWTVDEIHMVASVVKDINLHSGNISKYVYRGNSIYELNQCGTIIKDISITYSDQKIYFKLNREHKQ